MVKSELSLIDRKCNEVDTVLLSLSLDQKIEVIKQVMEYLRWEMEATFPPKFLEERIGINVRYTKE